DRLQLVLGSARLGVWDWNVQTDEGIVDARFADILGFTVDDLMPSSNQLWTSLTHPDDVPIEAELTDRHLRGIDEYYDMESRMRHRDGSWVWVRDRGKVVEWSLDGTPLRMTGTLEDISQARANADRLAAAEEQFRLAMDQSTIGMCLVSPEGVFMRVNPALCRIFGRTAEEMQRHSWQELTHPDDLANDLDLVDDVLRGKTDGYRLLKRYIHGDGSTIWGDLSVAIVRAPDGSGRYFISQIVDVTDQHVTERHLAEREELLRVVLDNSPDPTMRFNSDMRIEYVNKVMELASGKTWGEWVGRNFAAMGYPDELTGLWAEHCRRIFATGEPESFEIGIESVYGHRWAEASLAPELAPDGSVAHVVATIRDVTRRRRAEEDLLRLATHDTLTGLANRAVLADELDRAMQAAERSDTVTAILMVDLDRFKNVNDSLGHGTGDDLLRSAASRMQDLVRRGDLVARTGGDEFVVVMRELANSDDAVQMGTRIVEAFRASFRVDHHDLYATASVGVAIATSPTSADDLVREGDTAMYVAKSEGRDRVVVYNSELRAAVSTRLAIEGELRQALDLDQLEVWYQPEVDLVTGEVLAVEALLRWFHPDGVRRNADDFIEIAEETGLIVPIGEYVLHRACADAAEWARDRGKSAVVVRVNVSARQLAEPGLLAAIDSALEGSGLDPRLLCIEITETALLRSSGQAHANIEGTRERGVSIALDDFGTGYASLAYLREYPIDMLKIDRSFITRITSVDFDRQLVAGILALAAQLQLGVTAEGVETQGQATCLRELGCRGVQGFLFSQAVPVGQVRAMLSSGFAQP
ncbi:MAG: EAL domain-containing protein, partial [bacterium]|nr:EAL domain-containing protein [bacterium]